MPIVTEHPHGSPCWFELGTTDQDAAKQFYSQMFGWSIHDNPMGPAEVYTIFRLNGHDAGSAYTLPARLTEQGVAPHWGIYFAAPNVDEDAAKVPELGGSLVQKPFDVMENGRMAICQDPGGATFSLWQAQTHIGVGVFGDPNSVCWAELATWDTSKARDFYTGLFGWKTKGAANMATYVEYTVDGNSWPSGGLLPMNEQWGSMPSHWAIYFLVEDCDAAAARVNELGGAARMGPFDAPGVGRIAAMADPQGAAFYLITLKQAA
jgi:predicted enzyme related to lactoylglutathione lyase